MTAPVHQLDAEELWSAMEAINPITVLVEGLVGAPGAGPAGPFATDSRLVPWLGDGGAAAEPGSGLMLLEDGRTGQRCVLPAATLCMFRTAALVALAARELVAHGVVTAAVLGPGPAAQQQLTLIARYLSGLSHVAVCPSPTAVPVGAAVGLPAPQGVPVGVGSSAAASSGAATAFPVGVGDPVDARVADQLDLAGIGLSVTSTVADATFGATLVVATAVGDRSLRIERLARGTLLINATGEDLPDDLVDAVDQVFVDDSRLVGRNRHRYFVRAHLAELDPRPATVGRCVRGRGRRIEADLGQVLTGAHAGRTHVDDILLVELLGTRALDVRLASTLHQAALEHGLGARLMG